MNARNLLSVAAAFGFGFAQAATTVSDVEVHQHWPFDDGIDVTYTLAGDEPLGVDLFLSWDGQLPFFVPAGLLSGDFDDVSAGNHRISLDVAKLGLRGRTLTNFRADVRVADADSRKYLVLNLLDGSYAYTNDVPSASGWLHAGTTAYGTTNMVFRRIPAGTFQMGASTETMTFLSAGTAEKKILKARQVTLTDDCYMSVNMLTVGQIHAVTQRVAGVAAADVTFPASSKTLVKQDLPYDSLRGSYYASPSVNWPASEYAVASDSLIAAFRTAAGGQLPAGWIIDLPTAAQWERACKATTPDDQFWSSGGTVDDSWSTLSNRLSQVASWAGNGKNTALELRSPNGWGLYDMIGCRAEWVLDQEQDETTAQSQLTDPVGKSVTSSKPKRIANMARNDNGSFLQSQRWYWSAQNANTTWFSARLCIHTRNVFESK